MFLSNQEVTEEIKKDKKKKNSYKQMTTKIQQPKIYQFSSVSSVAQSCPTVTP